VEVLAASGLEADGIVSEVGALNPVDAYLGMYLKKEEITVNSKCFFVSVFFESICIFGVSVFLNLSVFLEYLYFFNLSVFFAQVT